MTKKQSLQILKGENYDFQNSNGIENSKKNISDEALPNRLLSAIPISDLGESLDSRHLSESFNGNSKFGKGMDFFCPNFTHCNLCTINLFVKSKNETTNSPIHQFANLKCCIKARDSFKTPF